jgi:uncharacterized membrane-anchored protein
MRYFALLIALVAASMDRVHSQEGSEQLSEAEVLQLEAEYQAYSDSVEASYTYRTGEIQLVDGVATVKVPDDFKFLDAGQSRSVLVEQWGNPPASAEGVLGMLFRADEGVLENSFAFVIEYDEMGYVSDEDADDINYDELLAEQKEESRIANEQRKADGYTGLQLVGWASAPYYDKDRKVLHWAKELEAEDSEENILNYNVRVLGRKGVLIMNAIANMTDIEVVKENIPAVLTLASFDPGHTYAEFDSNVDDVAAWTVGGLVAGKILAKTGLLALMLKNIKLLFIALAAIGGVIWKFFGGKKNAADPPAPQA